MKPKKVDKPNCEDGSVIGVENQTLGEVVPIIGTPFSLVYQSDRTPGYTADRTLTIPLTRDTLPPNLKRVELSVQVGGRQFTQSFSPSANLNTAFTWDGIDAYGRTLAGGQNATVEIGYVYDGVYNSPANSSRAFGATGLVKLSGNRARQEITLSQEVGANRCHGRANRRAGRLNARCESLLRHEQSGVAPG